MQQITKPILFIIAGMMAIALSACSGSSSSGNSDINTADIAGIYTGMETLELTRVSDSAMIDSTTNDVRISINSGGNVSYTTTNGTSGSAQLTNAQFFELRADARTQFNGRCAAGTVIINGQVNTDRTINGRYRSENLICDTAAHTVIGTFNASR